MTNSIKLYNDITLNSQHNGRKIAVDIRLHENSHKKPVIIFVHGFKGFKDWGHFNMIADHSAQEGFVFVKLNLSHNGTTPDQPEDFADLEAFSENNFSIELDDIQTVIDYVFFNDCKIAAAELDLDRCFIMGHSRGGGLALLTAAADDRIRAAATWAAVADFRRWTDATLTDWQNDGIIHILNGRTKQQMPMKYQIIEDLNNNYDRLDILKAVSLTSTPLLIIHGEDDETVDSADAQAINDASKNSEMLLIKDANHVFGASHPYEGTNLPPQSQEALTRTLRFFESK